jgi:diacylglycerol kinase family enzyme
MVVAYPANQKKGGRRKRSVLHFHLMPDSRLGDMDTKRRIRTESVGTEVVTEEAPQDDKETRKLNKHRMMTMFAAKLRDTWVHAITTTLFPDDVASGAVGYPSMSPGEGKRLLVIINPYAGTKNAQAIANRSLLPMLQQAGVEYEVLITGYAGHARELVRQEASDRWKGIVIISGDGLLFEVLNGLFDREDWREALECLSFGIIPAGSGNGLSRSLGYLQREQFHRKSHALSAAVNCARGSVRAMDLLYVETPMNGRLSFHSVFWGLVADIDIESEVLRWMGGVRFTIWALLKLIKAKRYRARLSYIPCNPEFTEDTRQILDAIHHKDPEEQSNPDESSSEDSNIQDPIKSQSNTYKISTSKEDNDIDNDSLASNKQENSKWNKKRHASKSSSHHYSRYNNKYNSTTNTVDNEDDMSLPHAQPPGTYLIPRYVSYGTMLAQGQLYDRSWQELQASILGNPTNKIHPAEQPPYGYHQMPPPEVAPGIPPALHSSHHSLGCPQHSQRLPPNTHPQQLLGEPAPSKNGKSKHRLKQQVSTSSSSYCAAAAALKR